MTMYAKTNLGSGQVSPRVKRVLLGTGIVVLLGLGGLGVWSAVGSDTYAGSGAGCVNVTVPSTMGGATLHYCGGKARTFCLSEFKAPSADPIAVRARPQCRLAGLTP